MKALCIYAGPQAKAHIEKNGLGAWDVGVIPGAAGGPKGLILGPLDRFIFGDWLPTSSQPVHLVGASIGAWRMATACLDQPVAAFEQLERDYIAQHYPLKPGQKRPTPAFVSEQFGQNLQRFYGGRVQEVLGHPRFKLHIIAARGRHLLGREHRLATPLGYLGAFLTNGVARKAMGAWLERVVFSTPGAALPFGVQDFRTRRVPLSPANFQKALQASCSIPFVLRSVRGIDGAPPGAYWDGGITDYHLHLQYLTWPPAGLDTPDLIASYPINTVTRGINDAQTVLKPSFDAVLAAAQPPTGAQLVLYPHFQKAVVPGWLDKRLPWRHAATPALTNMVLLAPNPAWVKTLPNGKLPDRGDFTHYGADLPGRIKAWTAATQSARQLADEWQDWLRRPDVALVREL